MVVREKLFGLNALAYASSLIIGIIIGYLGGPAIALAWWAATGLLIGWLSNRKKAGLANGSVYGFSLAYTFMLAGYSGKDSLSSRLVPFIMFGMVGAICGACLGLIGYLAHRKH